MRKRSVGIFGRRVAVAGALVAAVALLTSACTSNPEIVTVHRDQRCAGCRLLGGGGSGSDHQRGGVLGPDHEAPTLPANTVRISATPAFGSKNVPPNNPVKISVFAGKITELTMTGDDGTTVAGKTTPDQTSWASGERLDYNTTYTFAGTATSNNGKPTKITGKITTVKPPRPNGPPSRSRTVPRSASARRSSSPSPAW